MDSDAISCPFFNLNTLWYIIMTLHSYVEQVITMRRIQVCQPLLAYFLSYFPLIVLAAMLSILNTVRIIFMKLYGFIEEGMTMCSVYKLWQLSCSYEGISKSFEPNMERARNLDLFCFIFQRSPLPTPHTCPI